MAQHGGARPGSGRKPRHNVRVQCNISPEVSKELIRRENKTGLYRTRIMAVIVSEALIGGVVHYADRPPS
jgi:hypothetical protein